MSESKTLEDRVEKQAAELRMQGATLAQNTATLSALSNNMAELTRLLTSNGGEKREVKKHIGIHSS